MDERRVPDKGMRMRCPGCSERFTVQKDGQATLDSAGAPAPLPAPPPMAPPPAAPAVRPPGAAGLKGTMVGVAPAAAAPAAAAATGASKSAAPKGMFGGGGGGVPAPAKSRVPLAPPFASGAPPVAAPFPAGPPPAAASVAPGQPKPSPSPSAAFGTIGTKPKMKAATMVGGAAPPPAPPPPVAGAIDLPAPRSTPAAFVPPTPGGPTAKELDDDALGIDLPAPKGAPLAPDFDGVDLPAPKAAPLAPDFDGVDLPTPKGAPLAPDFGGVDLPAPKGAPLAPDFGGIDLPAPKGAPLAPDFDGIDLPTPKREDDFGGIDLPTPKLDGGADLPAPKSSGGGGGFGDIDLPTPKLGGADLPAPKSSGGGGGFGDIDLPTPRTGGGFGDIDLPAPAAPGGEFGALDLPAPAASSGMDEASFGDLNLPDLADPGGGQPEESFADIELPPPVADARMVPPQHPTAIGYKPTQDDESSFGSLNDDGDLPPSLMSDDETSFGDLDLGEPEPAAPPPPRPSPNATLGGAPMPPSVPTAIQAAPVALPTPNSDFLPEPMAPMSPDMGAPPAGGFGGFDSGRTSSPGGSPDGDFGALGDDGGDDFGDFGDDDDEMEFGIDGEEGEGFSLPPDILRRQRGEDFEAKQVAAGKRNQILMVIGAVLLVVGLAGGFAMGYLTHYGYFGIYLMEQYMPEAGTPQFARDAIARAEKQASTDTYRDVRSALAQLGKARGKASLNRVLQVRSVLHEGLYQLRFGEDARSTEHIVAILKRLEDRGGEAPNMNLARAADAARRKDWANATQLLDASRQSAGNDPYVDLVAGEIALVQGQAKAAEKAFSLALKNGGAARAQWGLARAALAGGDQEGHDLAVEETLKLSPLHVEARIEEARLVWQKGREARAVHLLDQVLGVEPVGDQRLWTSKPARASAQSLLGYVHESRGRLHLARAAYDRALELDPFRVEALLGAGRVMLRERRPNDSIARFESALSTAVKGNNPTVLSGRPAAVEAELGLARAQTALEHGIEAKAKLERLAAEHPEDYEILIAWGEAEQTLKHSEQAEALYRQAIELEPTRFDGYLSLAQLFFKDKQAAKASAALNDAASHVEETSEMRRMMGRSELARNRLDSALHEFRRALVLDPHDMDARFGLGQALRRNGELDEARAVFDELARRDAAYAGLSLERGLLLEADGNYAGAVETYKAALEQEKEKGNLELLLRLGAAQVSAGDLDGAEQTLQKVIRETPNSAEAEYFIGRVQFARGRTPDALTHFDRALSLDGTKAEFHLYAARAALEMGNLGRTREEIELTMQRDPSMGDAYWVRGEVRLRMGAVKDALRDLKEGIKLNPSRTEAYAAMGECYDQMRELGQAVASYDRALSEQRDNAYWHFRRAQITTDMGKRDEGLKLMKQAVALAVEDDPTPHWLPDAYRLAAELSDERGDRATAVKLYKTFLEVASAGHQDAAGVRRQLRKWGVQLEDDF